MTGMRVLVTGAGGFLGAHVAAELAANGHAVTALVRPASAPWRLAPLAGRIDILRGDLADGPALSGLLAAVRPEAVVHLAWEGVGNVARNDPAQARNIAVALDLVSAVTDAGARVFLGAGSQAEYGPKDHAIREEDATLPTTLYGHAKLAAGLMAGQLAAARSLRFAWLRVFSTYGPGDNPGWLIPDLIAKLRRGERMALTPGEQRWGFLHARDAAAAFHAVLEDEGAEGVFNLGSPDAPPLRETITLLRDLVDPRVSLGFGEMPYRPDQVMRLQANVGRLTALGWAPRIALAEGLAETVAAHG